MKLYNNKSQFVDAGDEGDELVLLADTRNWNLNRAELFGVDVCLVDGTLRHRTKLFFDMRQVHICTEIPTPDVWDEPYANDVTSYDHRLIFLKDGSLADFFTTICPVEEQVTFVNETLIKFGAIKRDALRVGEIQPAVISHVVHAQIGVSALVRGFLASSVPNICRKFANCPSGQRATPEHLDKPGFDEVDRE